MVVEDSLWIAKELFCGGTAGAVSVFIGHPFDMVKIRLQTMPGKHASALGCFKKIIDREGVVGLYRGLTSPLFAQFFMNGLSFGTNSICMQLLEPELGKGQSGSSTNLFFSGCLGGLSQCIVLVPTDLVKCKMQVDAVVKKGPQSSKPKYRGVFDCVGQIVRSEGVMGLYRGLTATCIREVPSFGLYFSVYAHTVDFLNTPKAPTTSSASLVAEDHGALSSMQTTSSPSTWSILFAGGLAGAVSWTVVYPVDVIKTYMQVAEPSANVGGEKGIVQTAKLLYHRHGWRVFFAGLGITMVRAFPVNAGVFYFYEVLRELVGIAKL